MSKPRVVALVCSYWKSRIPHIQGIVDALKKGTVVPDKIVVLNNNKETNLSIDGAEVINSQLNSRCRGKFVAPLLDIPANYYLLLDDDTSVGLKTLECFLRHAHRGCVFGYLGVTLKNESFHYGGRYWPDKITQVSPCDTFCGCGMFMAYDALIRTMILEERIRLGNEFGEWPHQGDDIIIGLANKCETVPMQGDEKFVDLGYASEAMCWEDPNYYVMRDIFTKAVLRALEKYPIPQF